MNVYLLKEVSIAGVLSVDLVWKHDMDLDATIQDSGHLARLLHLFVLSRPLTSADSRGLTSATCFVHDLFYQKELEVRLWSLTLPSRLGKSWQEELTRRADKKSWQGKMKCLSTGVLWKPGDRSLEQESRLLLTASLLEIEVRLLKGDAKTSLHFVRRGYETWISINAMDHQRSVKARSRES